MLDRSRLKESRLFILFLSASVALAPLAIDMYMPAMSQMANTLQVDFSQVNLTMSAYLFGNALGQFFGGSLSDQVGRKKIGITGLTIFFIAALSIVFTTNIVTIQWLRIVQAIGGGFAAVICLAQIRDVFPVDEVMKRYADVVMVMLVAPMVAPLLGVLLLPLGWQSIFAVMALISAVMAVIFGLLLPETRQQTTSKIDIAKLFAGYRAVIAHRHEGRITAIRYALYSGFCYGVFMCMITNVAMIFMQHYGFGELQFAIGFAMVGIGMIVGNRLAVRMIRLMVAENWLTIATSVQILCTALLLVLSSSDLLSAWAAVLLLFLTVIMSGSIIPINSARFVSFFDQHAGSAASLVTTISFGSGAIIGAIGAVLSASSITPVFATMLSSAIIALLILRTIHPIPTSQPRQQ